MKNIELKRWNKFVVDVLKEKGLLLINGSKPDKIIHVCTFDGAKQAMEILTKLKIKNCVVMSCQGFDKSVIMMATAMIVKDVMDVSGTEPKIYSEASVAYLDGTFPATGGTPDKAQWLDFAKRVNDDGSKM